MVINQHSSVGENSVFVVAMVWCLFAFCFVLKEKENLRLCVVCATTLGFVYLITWITFIYLITWIIYLIY